MTITEIKAFLLENDNYMLLTHARPDGDTVCSAAALCAALRRMGKRASMYDNPEITESYAEFAEPYIAKSFDGEVCVVSVDTASESMLPMGFEGGVSLAIDHHGSNSGYAALSYVEGGRASCGEIILDVIELLCGDVTVEEATLLYVAVSTDTGCFLYGNTNADALRTAARLLELGAPNGRLNKKLFRSHSLSRLKLEGLILSTMHSYRDNAINLAVVTREMMAEAGATEDDCDDIASLAGKVRGSVVAITVRELDDGRSKASVRTSDRVNASAICAGFGGGGHSMAAGCTVDASPWECAELLLRAAEEHFR